MKKLLAMILALVMLLSLCACGSDDSQATNPSSSSQVTTGSTEASTNSSENSTNSTESSTEATQPSTNAPTSAPADDPTTPPTQAPTEAPTAPPVTQPAACSHSWNTATCTAPKTCAKCGATEGSAAGHSWNAATCTAPKTCTKCSATYGSAAGHSYNGGTCSVCGAADPNYKQLADGAWVFTNDGSTVVLTFYANGVVSICALDVENTAEEFRKSWNEFTADEYSWYSVYDIGGTHYVAREEITYDSLYTVNGQTVSFEIFGFPESVTWDGYTVTVAAQSGSGWLNNMGQGIWIPSGVSIVDDLGPYFG